MERVSYRSDSAKDMSLRSYLTAQTHPVVFPLPTPWPCSNYTIAQWGDVLPEPFEFRHDSRKHPHQFEVEHFRRFRATIKDFGEAVSKDYFAKASVDLKQRWVYSAYNWMSSAKVTQKSCLDWTFFEQGEKDCMHTTIWFGSKDAFTPCHRDSYGLNLSVQLIGSKEWLLFPPSNGKYLYETRLPYEETTVFSSIDFNRMPVDLARWPLLKNATPYRVVLKPCQVLLVPKHWWHFVRCVDTASVNVNRWFDVESDVADKIDEALASLLVGRIHDLVSGPVAPFNSEEPVQDVKIIFESIRRSLEKMNLGSTRDEHNYAQVHTKTNPTEQPSSDDDESSRSSELDEDEVVRKYSISQVESCSIEEFTTTSASHGAHIRARSEFSTNDIFKSVLDSEVLALMREKINEKYIR